MSLSPGPGMKFFRWILSHLTIIIVLAVIIYFYWDHYGFWSDDVVEPTIKPSIKLPEQAPEEKVSFVNVDEDVKFTNHPLENKAAEKKRTELQMSAASYSSGDFSRRRNEYKQRLSVAEQKVMDNAGKTFQQEFNSVIQYPTDNDIKPLAKNNITETEDMTSRQVVSEVKEKIISQLPEDLQEEKTKVVYAKETAALTDKQAEAFIDKEAEALTEKNAEALIQKKAEALIENRAEALIEKEAEAPVELKVEQAAFATTANDEVESQQTDLLAVQKKAVKAQDKKLQQQIRDRQKQLQEKMILLIPLNAEEKTQSDVNNAVNNTNIKVIEPLIHTAEQKQLLNDARHAFDLSNFKVAEKKYLQLIKQLPELPDIVGELANVYKTQNKIPDYLVTNTQFVKRLVSHNRFNEAWEVVMLTDKIDKTSANKQRRIINKKQKELQM